MTTAAFEWLRERGKQEVVDFLLDAYEFRVDAFFDDPHSYMGCTSLYTEATKGKDYAAGVKKEMELLIEVGVQLGKSFYSLANERSSYERNRITEILKDLDPHCPTEFWPPLSSSHTNSTP